MNIYIYLEETRDNPRVVLTVVVGAVMELIESGPHFQQLLINVIVLLQQPYFL